MITGKPPFDLAQAARQRRPAVPRVGARRRAGAARRRGRAIGGVGGEAQLIGDDGKAIVFGGAPNLGFSVDPTQPEFNSLTLVERRLAEGRRGRDRHVDGSKKNLAVGQEIGVQARGAGASSFRISGLVKFGAVATIGGATLAGFDLPTAQRAVRQGRASSTRSGSPARPASRPAQLVAEIADDPPAGHAGRRAATTQAAERRGGHERASSRFLQTFLLAFGGIALFVGAFVIANSLSITIAQRTREFATLRTLGASRRQVLRLGDRRGARDGRRRLGRRPRSSGWRSRKGLFKLFDAVGFTLPNNGLAVRDAHDRRLARRRDRRHAAREPPPGDARDARAADRRRARGRDAARGPLRTASASASVRRSSTRVLASELRGALLYGALRQRSSARTAGVCVLDGPSARCLIFIGRCALCFVCAHCSSVPLGSHAARLAGAADEFGGRRPGALARRQRPAQPAAHRLDGGRADDRPRARDARRDARGRDHRRRSTAPSTSSSRGDSTRSPRRTTSRRSRSAAAEAAAKTPGVTSIGERSRRRDARLRQDACFATGGRPDERQA